MYNAESLFHEAQEGVLREWHKRLFKDRNVYYLCETSLKAAITKSRNMSHWWR